jgi:hypothetical protein
MECHAAENGYLDMLKLAHKHGASLTANRNFAWHWAQENKHTDIVKYIEKNVKGGRAELIKTSKQHYLRIDFCDVYPNCKGAGFQLPMERPPMKGYFRDLRFRHCTCWYPKTRKERKNRK